MRTFLLESRAERSFSKSFSPRKSCPRALSPTRYQSKPAQKWLRRWAQSASSHTLPAETCANWPIRPPLRGEKQEKKLLSAHVSIRNRRREKLEKKLSPHRFRLRQAVPKRNPPTRSSPHITPPAPPHPAPPHRTTAPFHRTRLTPHHPIPHHTPHTTCWHTGHPWPS